MNYFIERFYNYALLMRLHRPIGIFLLLWPTLWALWIASEGQPDLLILTVFILGVIIMRSAGCVINDYADQKFDPHVQRTKQRPLAAKTVSRAEALILFTILCLLALGLVLLLNTLTVMLSVVAVLLAISYPFTKRYTHWPQAYLGLAFGWGIPMAFAAQTGTVPPLAWALLLINLLWALVYDTLYAMVDREDDLQIGIKSTAILFGRADRTIIAGLQIIILGLLIGVGNILYLGIPYYLGILGAALLAFYQQWLIRDRSATHCFQAFLNNHWFGAVIFLGILVDYTIPA